MKLKPIAYEACHLDMFTILLFHIPNIVELLRIVSFQVTKPIKLIIIQQTTQMRSIK